MIAYADASVLMRLLLGQPDQLREWTKVKAPLTSTLGSVECFRTIDRLPRTTRYSAAPRDRWASGCWESDGSQRLPSVRARSARGSLRQ